MAGQLGIDILGFAVMSNHIHVVARNRPDVVATWSDAKVAHRWWNIFPQHKTADGKLAEPRETDLLIMTLNPERLAEIRWRLSSPPWFELRFTNRQPRASAHFRASAQNG